MCSNHFEFYENIVEDKKVYIIGSNYRSDYVNVFKNQTFKYNICGFDCEWASEGFVSLIQISFPDGVCFLIRILDCPDIIPHEILSWMKSPRRLKFGVNVLEDAAKLWREWKICLKGCVDLRHALQKDVAVNGVDDRLCQRTGLKNIAQAWLGLHYTSRLRSEQVSNWEASYLRASQVDYACLDSLVGALCPVEFLRRVERVSVGSAYSRVNDVLRYCTDWVDVDVEPVRIDGKKAKQCAVCGLLEGDTLPTELGKNNSRVSIKRRCIVPRQFFQHYPLALKVDNNLYLCVKCHQLSTVAEGTKKSALIEKYKQASVAAGAAAKSIVEYSKIIVENAVEEDILTQFTEEWHQHFVESMQPRHLPPEWTSGDVWF